MKTELIKKAKLFISDKGFGTGTNFTINTVINLMASFALEINSEASNESLSVRDNEQSREDLLTVECPFCHRKFEDIYNSWHPCNGNKSD
jgi:hypothetical protein